MRRHAERARPWLGNILTLAGALLAGAAILTVQDLAADLRDANLARDQLAQQVERLGGQPVAGPPGSRGNPGKEWRAPPARPEYRGSRGRLALSARWARPGDRVRKASGLPARAAPPAWMASPLSAWPGRRARLALLVRRAPQGRTAPTARLASVVRPVRPARTGTACSRRRMIRMG
ncbi:hypothetical protein ACFT7S_29760 [Streptomyces sp. NPDC057136]|uniref:hypothetical protein n=1 Tax=Streptomyces sp. NPDC057136 TaxID=3346029 RepID=UPI003644095B